MLILTEKIHKQIVYTITALCTLLIAIYFITVVFTDSNIVFYGGMRFAVGISVMIVLYSVLFNNFYKKNPKVALGLDLIFASILPLFLIDYWGGIDSPIVFLAFIFVIIGFLFDTIWGSIIEGFFIIFIAASFFIRGGDLVGHGTLALASIAASGIMAYIGILYRRMLEEKESLEKTNIQLSADQNKDDALLGAIADGVYVVDMDRNLKMFNEAAEEMTGWKSEDAIGMKCWTAMNLKNEEGTSICQKDCPALAVWNTGESVMREDSCFTKKRGTKKVQISSSYSPIKDKNGNLTGAICVFRDITEKKEVERLRNEFVSTASHELRTPITAIEGYMELIENEKICTIDDKAKEYLEKARNTALGMSNLVKNLLTVTKIEEGKIQTNVTKFSIHDLAVDVVEAMHPSATNKGLSLTIDESPSQKVKGEKAIGRSLNVVADREQIREVFYNLVENGLKFTQKGGVTISISYDNDNATVCIADTGMGIPAEGQKHLFEKFYRYDNTATREVGGTGLGLFITRSIVEMFGGTIWLESQVGKGTKFYFTVPRTLD